jgi:hypothetical protein
MLREHLPLNFIPTNFKELLAQKISEELLFNKIVTVYMSSFVTSFCTDFLFVMVSKWEMSSFLVVDI